MKKYANCRSVRTQRVFIVNANDLSSLLMAIVSCSRKSIVDIKYSVGSQHGTTIMVMVEVSLNYVEVEMVRSRLKIEHVTF